MHKTRHILKRCLHANQSQRCVLPKPAASIQFKGYAACDSFSRLSRVVQHAYIVLTLILYSHGALYTFLITWYPESLRTQRLLFEEAGTEVSLALGCESFGKLSAYFLLFSVRLITAVHCFMWSSSCTFELARSVVIIGHESSADLSVAFKRNERVEICKKM